MGSTQLPARLRAALERELCPGEEVEWLARPSPAYLARQGFRLGVTVALSAGMMVLLSTDRATMAFAFVLPFLVANLLRAAGWLGTEAWGASGVYVVTNQRCFQLGLGRRGVRVRELGPFAFAPDLSAADREVLEEHQRDRRQVAPLPARVEAARRECLARLSAASRAALHRALQPGETLLWADRPTRRGCLTKGMGAQPALHTTLLTIGAGAAWFAMVWAMMFNGPVLTALWTAAAVSVAAAGSFWLQIRQTLYAVTDRRGLVLVPGMAPATFCPEELVEFQRTQGRSGEGDLKSWSGDGFVGVHDVKRVDDLVKGRVPRDHSRELAPSGSPAEGRGDELAASGTPSGATGG